MFQAVGPVALVSLLLSDSLGRIVPGADDNENPNRPSNPKAQQAYNEAAVQVAATTKCSRAPIMPCPLESGSVVNVFQKISCQEQF